MKEWDHTGEVKVQSIREGLFNWTINPLYLTK